MKKSKKILLAASVVSIFIGVSMILGAWRALCHNAADAVAGLEFEEKHLIITDSFTNIHISSGNSSIELLPSSDGVCHIVCQDSEKLYYQISVTESVSGSQLNINQVDGRQWYEMPYGLFQEYNLSLQVYLPEAEYALLHTDSGSGDITIAPDFCFQTAYLNTTSGNTALTALHSNYLTVSSSSGDLILRSVEASEDINLETTSGFIQAVNLTAANVTTASSSGTTVLECVSSDYLRATAVSGDVHVREGNFMDTSYFESSNGNIEIVGSECGEQTAQTISGKVTLQNVGGKSLNAGTSSGAILIENSCYSGNLLCRTTSGEIMFTGADAGTLELMSSSGDISGDLLSSKNFIAETSSGFVSIPPSHEESGTCHVSTVSGNISITITS